MHHTDQDSIEMIVRAAEDEVKRNEWAARQRADLDEPVAPREPSNWEAMYQWFLVVVVLVSAGVLSFAIFLYSSGRLN